jgi:hypothetical protein
MRNAAKLQRGLLWTVILAESTHIFCCVLPTVITLLALLASFGAVAQMPVFILDLHEALHAYEIPVMIFSGVTLVAGWVVYAVARRIECRKDHCEPHENQTCAPLKDHTRTVLIVATFLLAINMTVYWSLHRPSEALLHEQAAAAHSHEHHDHHHGHHH